MPFTDSGHQPPATAHTTCARGAQFSSASEIAAAAVAGGVRAVAVSATYAADVELLLAELRSLRERLPAHVPLFAGGRAVRPLSRELAQGGIEVGENLDALRAALRRIVAAEERAAG